MESNRYLITGVTGYTGYNLAKLLGQTGAPVLGLARSLSRARPLPKSVSIELIPSSDKDLQKLVHDFRPTVIFHLASAFFGSDEMGKMSDNLAANFGVGFRVAQSALGLKDVRFINVSSYWEFDSLGARKSNSSYAALKSAFDHFLRALPAHLKCPFMSVVLFDVYGPQDWRPKFLNLLLSAVRRQDESFDMTEGRQLMNLLFVEDACLGLVEASGAGFVPEGCLALPGTIMSVRKLAELVKEVSASDIVLNLGKLSYSRHQVFDPVKNLPTPMGWTPRTQLPEGIKLCLNA